MKEKEVTLKAEYVLRLERGEEIVQTLTDFCTQKGITNAVFRAIGAIEKIKMGYYDLPSKKYGWKTYDEAMEVASMTGNVALVEDVPFVHVHAVLSGIAPGTENQPVGGHIFEANVAVTLEVHLTAYTEAISRVLDEDIGLKLLQL